MKLITAFADALQDLRFGWRQLAKAPVFAAVVPLTLSSRHRREHRVIFSVTNAILLRLLPVREALSASFIFTPAIFPVDRTATATLL